MTIPEHHMGDSRTKKRVSWYDTEDWDYIMSMTSDYNGHDCFDAFCICQFRIIRLIRLYGMESEERHKIEKMAFFYRKRIDAEFFAAEMRSLFLVTSIDVRNHGEKLSKPFLSE